MALDFPKSISAHLKNADFAADTIGRSKANVYIFDNGCVVKAEPASPQSNRERDMLLWLDGKLPAPKLIEFECRDGINYLLMTRLDGKMSCSEEFFKNPARLGALLAEGLKMLWDVDISTLPDSAYSLEEALSTAKVNLDSGCIDTNDLQYSTLHDGRFSEMGEVYEYLVKNKPTSPQLVFSHGDYCLPNIFLGDGCVSGFLDLGHSGAGECWNDIALCVRSLKYNAEEFFHVPAEKALDPFFSNLPFPVDNGKTNYYILLDEFF
ncbi:MAG: aminoglycoside 3'-phosphotransferase [Oscillospiraceae bacterium]|nr:aminoglycoside 3'-phosphotransferase [Oscillospiraceae bacterium]